MPPLKWETLPTGHRKVVVDILLRADYSRAAIGTFFGTSKNAIVGCQHAHLPWLTNLPSGSKLSISPIDAQRLLGDIDFDMRLRAIDKKKAEYLRSRPAAKPASKKISRKSRPRPKRTRPKKEKKKVPRKRSEKRRTEKQPPREPPATTETPVEPAQRLPPLSDIEHVGGIYPRNATIFPSEHPIAPITDEEVETAFRSAVSEEADALARLEESATEEPKVVRPPKKETAPVSVTKGCRYPVEPGRGLKQVEYCEDPVVYGQCCHAHAMQLFSSYRRAHSKRA